MKTVYKFPFEYADFVMIEMPEGAEILCVDIQTGPVLWALVDPAAPLRTRSFRFAGTGHPVEDNVRYIDSCIEEQGGMEFVWHLFEIGE